MLNVLEECIVRFKHGPFVEIAEEYADDKIALIPYFVSLSPPLLTATPSRDLQAHQLRLTTRPLEIIKRAMRKFVFCLEVVSGAAASGLKLDLKEMPQAHQPKKEVRRSSD